MSAMPSSPMKRSMRERLVVKLVGGKVCWFPAKSTLQVLFNEILRKSALTDGTQNTSAARCQTAQQMLKCPYLKSSLPKNALFLSKSPDIQRFWHEILTHWLCESWVSAVNIVTETTMSHSPTDCFHHEVNPCFARCCPAALCSDSNHAPSSKSSGPCAAPRWRKNVGRPYGALQGRDLVAPFSSPQRTLPRGH